MSERSAEHATFSVERVYDASPGRTFAAWSDPEAKSRWYSDPEQELELEFRVGGWERHGGRLPDGQYEMRLDGVRISVSLATAEFQPDGDGTRLVYTEQGAYFDGHEAPGLREHGMGSLLDLLGKWLARPR